MYLLFSECNFSTMLTRLRLGVLASLLVNIVEELVIKRWWKIGHCHPQMITFQIYGLYGLDDFRGL